VIRRVEGALRKGDAERDRSVPGDAVHVERNRSARRVGGDEKAKDRREGAGGQEKNLIS
jgi:hypothetical protein